MPTAAALALLLSGGVSSAQPTPARKPAPPTTDAKPAPGGKPASPPKPSAGANDEPEQPASPESAAALFRRGMDLMQTGKRADDVRRIAAGCEALRQSQALQPNLSTQFRLGQCYDRIGRRASALNLMTSVAADALAQGKKAEHLFAHRSANELAPRVPYLALMLSPQTAALPGLQASLDGKTLPPAELTNPIAVDNGSYRLRVQAPGHQPFEMTARVGDEHTGKTIALWIPPLDVVAITAEPQQPESEGLSPFRTAAVITGATGAAMMAASGFMMIPATRLFDETTDPDSDLFCDNTGSCHSQAGADQRSQARTLGTVATALFAAGGAALGTGVVLWIVDPDPEGDSFDAELDASLNLLISPTSLTLSGRF